MPSSASRFLAFCAAIISLVAAPITSATSFSSVIVYGDSLSDNGNLFALSGRPAAPYYNGRFSNGPVAVEQLASNLGVPLHDFAFGGATSGVGNYADGGTQTTPGGFGLPGMLAELAGSSAILNSPLTPTSLFVVWGGANDFVIDGSPTVAVADIDFIVASLENHGATHILVPGITDLGLTPDYYNDPAATAFSSTFNTLLQASLPGDATYVDTFNLLHQVEANHQAYGITDITDPCFDGTSVCANPNQYLFWDGFHPTTAVDAIVAQDFAAALTPEPSSILLTASGLSGLLALARRRKQRRNA